MPNLALRRRIESGSEPFYLITDKSLEPSRHAARSNLLETEHLKQLLAVEPAQLQCYATSATLINRRLAQVDHVVDLRMSQGFKAARKFVGRGSGKQLQD